ncbi:hypothetical protein D4L85_26820 [Chryseolinea soli]|uniref:Uncharacterized protein n=1 Tax=Chryseolinea soli TaxID=2321403 RepID=A0A385SW80_9BACT|nr:hypothetical protein D4L85_26820 [Chryseolinea soli]
MGSHDHMAFDQASHAKNNIKNASVNFTDNPPYTWRWNTDKAGRANNVSGQTRKCESPRDYK